MSKRTAMLASLAVIGALLVAACASDEETIAGSGNIVTRQQEVEDFSVVEASSTFEVNITRAASFSVSVTADDNLFDHISVSRIGRVLKIDVESGLILVRHTLKADIAMPELKGVRLSGVSRGNVTGFRSSDDLDIDLSGASRLDGDIGAGDADINLSGASRLTLQGSAEEIKVEASGASTLELGEFPVDRARVTLSGASRATVDVRKELGPVSLSGASTLVYAGDPSIRDLSTSGASRIQQE